MVRERLDEEAIQSPFTSLLTESVINVSKLNKVRIEYKNNLLEFS